MLNYPVLLSLDGENIVIIGVGHVGKRKLQGVLACKPKKILLFDPAFSTPSFVHDVQLQIVANDITEIEYHSRPYTDEDLLGAMLVFVATNNTVMNQTVADFCKHNKILCNRADGKEGGVSIPASIRHDPITITISTDGASPALSRRIRQDLEQWLGGRYTTLAKILEQLRPLLIELGLPTTENTRIFRAIINSDIMDLLQDNNIEQVEFTLKRLLPESLWEHVKKVLHGI